MAFGDLMEDKLIVATNKEREPECWPVMRVVGKTGDAGDNNNSPRYMRETVLLSFASVLKISYVFITKDEHTFFFKEM